MSLQSEINRIAGAKSDIADAIEGKGVTVPSDTKLDGMANLIGQISGGSGKLNSTQAADAYDPTATYAVGDKVSYAGNVYSCISAISTPEAWDSTHWDQVDPIQDQIDDVRNTLNSVVTTVNSFVPSAKITRTSQETGTINCPSASRHFLLITSSFATVYWFGYLIVASNGTPTAVEFIKGSDTTIATSTNIFSITSGRGSTSWVIADIILLGNACS